jgi:hypothetical protein
LPSSKLNFCTSKDSIKKWKTIYRMGENICKLYIWQETLIQTIVRALQIYNKRHPIKNRQTIWIGIYSEET